MRAKRRTLDPDWIGSASLSLQDRLIGLDLFANASTVGCYMALPREVRLDAVMEQCRRTGKTVTVPAWRLDSKTYGMARLDPGAAMTSGLLGIAEPASPEWVESVDLVLVPGVAFDTHGRRLGRGGGYYDRILSGLDRRTMMVGVAFDFQVVSRVPVEAHDVRVDVVVTETRCLWCGTRAAG